MKTISLGSAVCFLFLVFQSAYSDSRLIGGTEVQQSQYPELTQISVQGASCTATVIGPKVIVTAGHCAATDAIATFKIGNISYEAKMLRSPYYTSKGHDVALGLVNSEIKNMTPATVGGVPVVGQELTLFGYGVTSIDGLSDNKLRAGKTVIVSFTDVEISSRRPSGAGICFGDSGGPAFAASNDKRLLLGIASKGDCIDKNFHIRSDMKDSKDFFTAFAQSNKVDICGITKTCDGPIEPPPAPTCVLTANPPEVKQNEPITLSLVVQGKADSAILEGTPATLPTATKTITPKEVGTWTARASATGPGGTGTCEAIYVVNPSVPPPPPPTCKLSAIPDEIKLGETLKLEMLAIGSATDAKINNQPVGVPVGTISLTPTTAGSFTAQGWVKGPGGESSCIGYYDVKDDHPLPSENPELAVVPIYCGSNVTMSRVSRVCVSLLKKQEGRENLQLQHVLLVIYRTTRREVLPIIHRKKLTSTDLQQKEELTVYANDAVSGKDYMVLDSRKALLTYLPDAQGNLKPKSLEGRTQEGVYYLIEKLSETDLGF